MDRKLSVMETIYIVSQPNYNAAVVEVNTRLDSFTFSSALNLLQKRYPSLRRNTHSSSPPFSWREVSCPPRFRIAIHDDWRPVVQEEFHHLTFFVGSSESLLWSSLLIQSPNRPMWSTFVIFYDHSIGDGMSKSIMTHTLMNYYCELKQGIEPSNTASLPALPSIFDHQLAANGSSLKVDQAKVNSLVKQAEEHNRTWKTSLSAPYSGKNSNVNRFVSLDGSAENLKLITERCHQHKTTVGCTLLLSAAWAMAKLERLKGIIPHVPGSKFKVNMNMDANERNRVSPPLGYEHVQLFISIFPIKVEVDDNDSFWEASAKLREMVMAILPDTIQYQAAWEKLEEKGERFWDADANFSSMGRNPFKSEFGADNLKVEKMHHVGTRWAPLFGRFLFLSQSVDSIGYDVVYEPQDEENATSLGSMWKGLMEESHKRSSSYTFEHYLKEK